MEVRAESRAAAVLAWVMPSVALAAAIALAAFSLQSYEFLKRYLDTFAGDGDAEAFTRDLFASLVVSSRLAAVALIGVAGALLVARRRIARAFESFLTNTIGYGAHSIRAALETLRTETAWHLAALASIVALGVAVRVRSIGQPINYDEAFTYVQYASRPFLVGLSNYSYPNNHLLHTLLVHGSIQVFGSPLWAIRIPALVAGCAAIPLSYAVARRLTGRREALIVAALVSVSELLITFSVVARGYSLLVMFFLLALCSALDIVVTRSRVPWTAFTVLCAAGFFTIPLFLYPYGGLMLWLAWARFRDPQNDALRPGMLVRSAAGTMALAAACYAPAAATTGLRSGLDYALPTVQTGFVGDVPALIAALQEVLRGMPIAFVVVLLACAVLAIRQRWRTAAGILPIAVAAFPAVVVPIQGKLAPGRAWLYLLPVFFVYAAAGVVDTANGIASRAARKATSAMAGRLSAGFVLIVLAYAVTHAPSRFEEWPNRSGVYGDTDLHQVADFLKGSLTPDDALVTLFPNMWAFEYYLRLHDVPLAPFKNPPRHPKRLIVLTNETKNYTLAQVLAGNAASFRYAAPPRLLRTFVYSSVYEVELSRP